MYTPSRGRVQPASAQSSRSCQGVLDRVVNCPPVFAGIFVFRYFPGILKAAGIFGQAFDIFKAVQDRIRVIIDEGPVVPECLNLNRREPGDLGTDGILQQSRIGAMLPRRWREGNFRWTAPIRYRHTGPATGQILSDQYRHRCAQGGRPSGQLLRQRWSIPLLHFRSS